MYRHAVDVHLNNSTLSFITSGGRTLVCPPCALAVIDVSTAVDVTNLRVRGAMVGAKLCGASATGLDCAGSAQERAVVKNLAGADAREPRTPPKPHTRLVYHKDHQCVL